MRDERKQCFLAAAILLTVGALAAPALWYYSLPVSTGIYPDIESYTPQLSCSGSIQAAQTSSITLNVPVCVGKVYVENGSYVTQGQKLFEVDRNRLYKIALQGQDDSLDDETLTQAALAMGQLNESVLWQSMPQAVYASESGYLSGFEAKQGSLIGADTAIASITADGEYTLRLTVPEDRLGLLTPGCSVAFSAVAYPEREYYATVSQRPAQLRRQQTTAGYKNVADVWATVDAQDEFLAPGLTVTAQVFLSEQNDMLTVPYTAVGRDEKGQYVVVRKNGKAKKQHITTGIELQHTVQVTDGLKIYDKIAQNANAIKTEGEWLRWE